MATTFMVPCPSSGCCWGARFDLVYEPGGYRPRRGRTERRTDHWRLLTTFCYWKRLGDDLQDPGRTAYTIYRSSDSRIQKEENDLFIRFSYFNKPKRLDPNDPIDEFRSCPGSRYPWHQGLRPEWVL